MLETCLCALQNLWDGKVDGSKHHKKSKNIPAKIGKECIVFRALELFIKCMKFSDAVIYMQAIEEGTAPLYTFDREDFKSKSHAVLIA